MPWVPTVGSHGIFYLGGVVDYFPAMISCRERAENGVQRQTIEGFKKVGVNPHIFIYEDSAKPKSRVARRRNTMLNQKNALSHFYFDTGQEYVLMVEDDLRVGPWFGQVCEALMKRRPFYAFTFHVPEWDRHYPKRVRKRIHERRAVQPGFYELVQSRLFYGTLAVMLSRECAGDLLNMDWSVKNGRGRLVVPMDHVLGTRLHKNRELFTWIPSQVIHRHDVASETNHFGNVSWYSTFPFDVVDENGWAIPLTKTAKRIRYFGEERLAAHGKGSKVP
jgi:hypothetical protein